MAENRRLTEEGRAKERARLRAWYAANRDREHARKAREYAANPQREKRNSVQAAWRAANLEKARALAKKYDRDNREKRRLQARERYKKNADYWREWYRKNRAKVLLVSGEWAKANPDARRAIKATRRGRERGASGTYTQDDVKKLLRLQRGKCVVCRVRVGEKYHVDHLMPLALGGDNNFTNLQILCPSCNCSKNAKDPIKFMQQKGYLL